MDLIRDILDKQLLDKNGTNIGKVDGLIALFGEGQPQLVALETGPVTLARRSGFAKLLLKLFGSRETTEFRIAWTKVKDIGIDVRVELTAGETALHERHTWFRRTVFDRIPGGGAHGGK
jgi:sporulation protein YlmC with PRC-barrel domain